MKFPEKYIKDGKRTLHSGGSTDIFYDVNEMLTEDFYFEFIIDAIPKSPHYVGISTAGAIIGRFVSSRRSSAFSMVKDGELKGYKPTERWILIDDVVTTGNSLLEAITLVGTNPEKVVVVMDRRQENINPEVDSIFNI